MNDQSWMHTRLEDFFVGEFRIGGMKIERIAGTNKAMAYREVDQRIPSKKGNIILVHHKSSAEVDDFNISTEDANVILAREENLTSTSTTVFDPETKEPQVMVYLPMKNGEPVEPGIGITFDKTTKEITQIQSGDDTYKSDDCNLKVENDFLLGRLPNGISFKVRFERGFIEEFQINKEDEN